MFEVGEDKGGFCGDVTDLLWAGGDLVQGTPSAGEQGEAAFTLAAQCSQQGVTGAGVDVEAATVGRWAGRGVHAGAGALGAGVG